LKNKEGVIGCISNEQCLSAGVAGNTFALVWFLHGAPENGEIRLGDKGPRH